MPATRDNMLRSVDDRRPARGGNSVRSVLASLNAARSSSPTLLQLFPRGNNLGRFWPFLAILPWKLCRFYVRRRRVRIPLGPFHTFGNSKDSRRFSRGILLP